MLEINKKDTVYIVFEPGDATRYQFLLTKRANYFIITGSLIKNWVEVASCWITPYLTPEFFSNKDLQEIDLAWAFPEGTNPWTIQAAIKAIYLAFYTTNWGQDY